MKRLLLLPISLILISGCSSEISPEGKRNNFDACVIEEVQKIMDQLNKAKIDSAYIDQEKILTSANNKCVKYLK